MGMVDELFTVPPEQFVATRDALVRQLRAGGDKAEAARVAKLRRPPVTAWALNYVARRHRALIEALLATGDQLRLATELALAGDASLLRPARADERAAVERIVAEAVHGLEQSGYAATDAIRQRLAATLRAAVVDQPVAELLRTATLASDHDAPGFGMDANAALSTPDAPHPGNPPAVVAVATDNAVAAQEMPVPQASAEETQREADRLAAEAVVHRLSEEAGRLADEADALVAQADLLNAEADQLNVEAHALIARTERLAAEATRLKRAASQAREQAAERRAQAEQARSGKN